ncbi:MAG: HK97-gp10 family putative phage morphogenesis protein [[Actinobacillus] rossii]|nr:HK97 gp10 family phage protein [[Actinobacillus] rossii]MDY4505359.1 HK97-gp10 family putative phage morphogenesis protein [[Actinobacillus] rossii]
MGNLTVKITGLKELGQAMNSLERKVKNRIAVKAMRKGGAIIREQARASVPTLKHQVPHRKRGTLRKAISSSTKMDKSGTVRTTIFVRQLKTSKVIEFKGTNGKSGAYNPNDPFYWRFVEFGTSKMPAQPFLQPAFSAKKEQATREIITTLRNDILQEAKR